MQQKKKTGRAGEQAQAAEFSLTVSRALRILSMFSPTRPQLGLAEIARDTRLSKPSVLRFMQSLLMHGYIEQDEQTKKYRPGVETFRIGSLVGGWRPRTIALPVMRSLAEDTGFTTYLSVRRVDRMVVMASVDGRGPLRFSIPLGTTIPVHSTSSGQAALSVMEDAEIIDLLRDTKIARTTQTAPATLPQVMERIRQVRSQGYALSWEMTSPGVGSVSAPVVDGEGKLAAVLTTGFGTGQVEKSETPRLGAKINAAARAVSAALRNSAEMTEGEH